MQLPEPQFDVAWASSRIRDALETRPALRGDPVSDSSVKLQNAVVRKPGPKFQDALFAPTETFGQHSLVVTGPHAHGRPEGEAGPTGFAGLVAYNQIWCRIARIDYPAVRFKAKNTALDAVVDAVIDMQTGAVDHIRPPDGAIVHARSDPEAGIALVVSTPYAMEVARWELIMLPSLRPKDTKFSEEQGRTCHFHAVGRFRLG
jgi:hypothetical protein